MWPGPCVFPDYTQSSARSWWAELVKAFISNGVDGIWNDMNEPAVFKVKSQLFFSLSFWLCYLTLFFSQTVTKTMPESNIHRGDEELGGRQKHSYYHNVLVATSMFICC